LNQNGENMPDCRQLITSEDSRDYIVEYNETFFEMLNGMEGICLYCIDDTWCLLSAKTQAGYEFSIGQMGYYSIPKLYGLMDTTGFDASGITATINQPFLNVRGQGVIIGFVDTGIDYLREEFQFSPGRSKIVALWDQTIEPQGEVPKLYPPYGTVFTREQINAAILANQQGEDPYTLVPSKDSSGHGTFLAGVAAAAQTDDYTGAAPEAELLIVKLKPAKKSLKDFFLVNEKAECFSESDIMTGIRFLQLYARQERKPLVICLGLGTSSGPHTGGTPLAQQLNDVAKQVNTVVVLPTGNEANNRLHVSGEAYSSTQGQTIEINVGEKEKGFVMEIWASTLDVLSISLISPSGEVIPRIPARLGTSNRISFLLEQSTVTVDYRVVETISGFEVIFLRFINPANGIWRINVYSLTNIVGKYNAWLPLKEFMTGDTYFLNSDADTTLTEPSAAQRPITVGAYNHLTEAAYISSGRGFTAEDQVKPDLAAPGVDVFGMRVQGGFTRMTGTSIAAAHVAGAAALLLTWGVYYQNLPYMGTNEVKSMLIRGAKRDDRNSYPNTILGYGKMNLLETFLNMRIT
jgi:subtilisin family serine protease